MSKRSWKWMSMAGLVWVGILGRAQAAEISFSDSVPVTLTNWENAVTIPKFDPALGTLSGVAFQLVGHLQSDIRFENKSPESAEITSKVEAEILLKRPDQTPLAVVLPLWSHIERVTGFDGVRDYNGDSGRTFLGVTANESVSGTSQTPADLALFTATLADEAITMPVSATGISSLSGAANFSGGVITSAFTEITVTYLYEPPELETPIVIPDSWSGLTPGFWKQKKHFKTNPSGIHWPECYSPYQPLSEVFGKISEVGLDLDGDRQVDTLLDALRYQGGPDDKGTAQILLRAAVAAVLNEASFGENYPPYPTVKALVGDVNETLVSKDRDTMLSLARVLDFFNNGENPNEE